MSPTTRRNETGNTETLRKIAPNAAGSGAGGGAGGGGAGGGAGTPVNRPAASPTGPAPLLGEPEFIPQHTFIALPRPNDNGFITNAVNFHTNAGLSPRNADSIEEILELLAKPAETGQGVLDRIRIVSHFFVPDPGEPDQPSNMGIKFLRDGGRGALKRFFEGFADSSIAGLRAMLTFDLANSTSPLTIFASPASVVLAALRAAGDGALVDPVFPSGGTPSAARDEFVVIHGAKWLLTNQATVISEPALRTNLGNAYDVLLADLKERLTKAPENLKAADLNALAAAIGKLSAIGGANFVVPANTDRYAANVSAALIAVAGDTFRKKMLAVRPRFDRFTTIDIRGCRAGTDMAYLASVQGFFGQSATVRPVVTAPDFFQRFNQVAAVTIPGDKLTAAVSLINGLHNNGLNVQGIPTFTAAEVRDQFGAWADAFGITAAHLTFWHTTFRLGVLEFSKLGWRGSIPAAKVTAARLAELASVSFADLFARLGEIFFIPTRPSQAQITALTALLPNLAAWTTQLAATIDPASTAADLTAHFDNFKAIYEAVDARFADAVFKNSPQRLIPPTQPTGLTVAQMMTQTKTYQTNLRTFIQDNANSRFASVRVFLAAVDGRTQGDPARMRYFLGLGLAFHLANLTDTRFTAQQLVLVADPDSVGARQRQLEAIRHWMRSAWRGVTSITIAPTVTYDRGRHSSWVVSGRDQGPSAVCPHARYMSHIKTQPA